jgi:hypothetical protein
MAPPRYKLGGK